MTIFHTRFDSCKRRSSGFTLLEVMLAMALSMVVIAAIGSAITMYLRLFDSGRTNIEEAQLARALLRRMGDDIRGAVPHNTVDASQLVSLTSAAASGTTGAATGGTSPSASTFGTPSNNAASGTSPTDEPMLGTSELESLVVDEATDLSSAGPQTMPGLYGNSCQLQIDVSRLPRIDQYMFAGDQGTAAAIDPLTGSQSSDHVSDLRNVAYYIFGDSASIAMGSTTGMPMGFGLVRRDMDRASALFATQSGQEVDLEAAAEVIAPEVESIRFAYFDGLDWYETWDSTQNGGLPMAVQITVAIARPAKQNGETQSSGVYSLLVHIPTAKVTSAANATATETGTEESMSSPDASSTTPTTPSTTPTTPSTTPSSKTSGQSNQKKK